jgi:hypothetical protein
MNILFIGPYRQSDTWGETSRNLIKTLSVMEDCNLTTRPIYLSTSQEPSIDADILKCESTKKDKYDILVQHMLPSYMINDSTFDQVIGFTGFETIGATVWDNHLNLLDKVFVTTEAEKNSTSEDVFKKTYSIGIAHDKQESKQEKNMKPFTFYTLGGNLEIRTGVRNIIQAYFSSFTINDQVLLVLQANDQNKASSLIDEVRKEVGITSDSYYPAIHIVNETTSLHESCCCFVDASHSLGFNPETIKAVSHGSVPIVVKNSGRDEYIDNSNGLLVESYEDVVLCPDRPIREIFTARETCFRPIISSLRDCMLEVYSSKISYLKSLNLVETA